MQTAETTGAGNFELGIEPGVPGVIITSVEDTPFSGFFDFSVSAATASRRASTWVRASVPPGPSSSKVRLSQDDATVLLSLAPTVGGFALGAGGIGAGFINWKLPPILGIPLGDHQIVLGPRVSGTTIFAPQAATRPEERCSRLVRASASRSGSERCGYCQSSPSAHCPMSQEAPPVSAATAPASTAAMSPTERASASCSAGGRPTRASERGALEESPHCGARGAREGLPVPVPVRRRVGDV